MLEGLLHMNLLPPQTHQPPCSGKLQRPHDQMKATWPSPTNTSWQPTQNPPSKLNAFPFPNPNPIPPPPPSPSQINYPHTTPISTLHALHRV
jgi:hypothetical protein